VKRLRAFDSIITSLSTERTKAILKNTPRFFMMTEPDSTSKADVFGTSIKRLRGIFSARALVQTEDFDEIRKFRDQLYPHVLSALDYYPRLFSPWE
jgi:hypothetical protein